uniref:Uncharacterized protein n=1 Tax=Oryza rufipogon TaxID=4529 RepID=A0A0E0R3Q8_ORYRU
MTPDDMAATCSMKCPQLWGLRADIVDRIRHAEQPALRTLLAPEKRLLVRSGTEDWTEAYNLFKEQGIKDLVVNVK